MDNITHSLIGIAIAEEAVQYRRHRGENVSKVAQASMWLVSLAANNLPDLDFFYSPITKGPLGYLLHHRGHTHSLAAILPQVLAMLLPIYFYNRWKKLGLGRKDFGYLWLMAGFGIGVHIFLDGLNSYGIHPFWPFQNKWYYDDSVFIVEPWIWVTLIPVLVQLTPWKIPRFFFALIWCVALVLLWITGLVPKGMALLVTLWGVALYFGIARLKPLYRVFATSAALLFVLSTFVISSRLAKAYVLATFPADGWTHLDTIASPLPSNPLCWAVMEIQESDDRAQYRVVRALVAPFPQIYEARHCDFFKFTESTAPVQRFPYRSTPGIHFLGYFQGSAENLRELNARNCFVSEYLKFARAPFALENPKSLTLGDMRFDRRKGADFAELTAPLDPQICPKYTPNWDPPRSDLLSPGP
ncbi:MAG: metal-dependent hydrolase [Bdellovibrionaceae bacterium]|nr:metal-dependent hydrolase [Bdellovibrionales bacterium]MCB9253549.1 metal-dependent hydrolase [Pseudobdellovibrionaceae bacterium]